MGLGEEFKFVVVVVVFIGVDIFWYVEFKFEVVRVLDFDKFWYKE